MRVVVLILISAALVADMAIPVWTQSQTARFATRTDAVRVSVMASNKGRPLTGLTRRDFDVFDNGVRQTVELVDREDLGLDLLLALDDSSSIWKRGLNVPLKAAALAALAQLRRGDRAGLVHFDHHVSVESQLTSDIPALAARMYGVKRNGGTAVHDAIVAAVVAADPAPARRTLLLVYTDGIDTISWNSPVDVLALAERTEVVVCAVVPKKRKELRREARLGEYPTAWQFLTEVTSRTGGELIEVEANGLSSAFAAIMQRFAQGYQLAFYPTGVDQRGWHRLDVRLRTKNGEVKARRGYYAD